MYVNCLDLDNQSLSLYIYMQETQEMHVQSLGQEDPLEEKMATHSRIAAWRIPWTKELSGLHCSPWGRKESGMTGD